MCAASRCASGSRARGGRRPKTRSAPRARWRRGGARGGAGGAGRVGASPGGGPPPPLRARRPAAPAAVEQALARALAKDPADRFASVAEFVVALEATHASDAAPTLVGKTRSLAV